MAIFKKTIEFHWNQSEYYLSEMLRMHWDLIKILPMITKIAHDLWSHPFLQRGVTEVLHMHTSGCLMVDMQYLDHLWDS